MKKKIVISILGIFVIMLGALGIFNSDNNQIKLENGSNSSNLIAMYIENDDGEYVASTNSAFPTDGYVLNTEKSSCQNGGKPSQDATTKAISLSTSVAESCTLYFEKEKIPLVDVILSKANNESITDYTGATGEMYVFNHEATTQTSAQKDYRYIGNVPNNYIEFNDEMWRIIGVFPVETESGNEEQLVKIIRNEIMESKLFEYGWMGVADWSNTNGKKVLNGDYYNQTGNFISSSETKGLSELARKQVVTVKWYLGEVTASEFSGEPLYIGERSNNRYYADYIFQNIGLMYASDYMYTYANGATNGWLLINGKMQSTLSVSNWLTNPLLIIHNDEIFETDGSDDGQIRPCLYLDSKLIKVSGDGSLNNPYRIE